MGVKSASSPDLLKKAAVHNYERTDRTTLRPEQKEVTIRADIASAIKKGG
jgi:hypothetical protein